MIATARSASFANLGRTAPQARAARDWTICFTVATGAEPPRAAPVPAPRPFLATLQALLTDGAALRRPTDRSRAAAQAFGAGDGFLPGQIIDRVI